MMLSFLLHWSFSCYVVSRAFLLYCPRYHSSVLIGPVLVINRSFIHSFIIHSTNQSINQSLFWLFPSYCLPLDRIWLFSVEFIVHSHAMTCYTRCRVSPLCHSLFWWRYFASCAHRWRVRLCLPISWSPIKWIVVCLLSTECSCYLSLLLLLVPWLF